MHHELSDSFLVSANPADVWEFFSSPLGLPKITPPWLDFTILPPVPDDLRRDSLLQYRIRWMGVPVGWRTRIVEWTPPTGFVDLQIRGPYTFWHHRHEFATDPRGTRCRDTVIYKVPGGPLGTLLHDVVIRRQLLEIFRFRRRAVARHLGWVRGLQKDVRIRRLG